MKKLLLSAAIFGVAALAITAKTNKNNDPVVMTVDNRDVKLSEFEYLYNKNNNQQLTPLTFDEYVDMFVNYKLKVADALNAKLDTTEGFKAEFEKFRRDLAQPYLKDTVLEKQLVQEAYDHTADEVFVSHIMLSLKDPMAQQKIDSLRALIISGQETFEDVARHNSVDRGSASNGGRMAWVTGMSPYPWAFEKAAYDTPVGEISEVVNSGVGLHLIRPEERRPSRGQAKVQHILLLTRNMDAEQTQQVKEKIDSIYNEVIKPGVDFAEVAKKESQDPGSAAKGGLIDWFGSGRMVAEFDSVSFALPDGGISEPFATSYGYHIVHKLAHRDRIPYEEAIPMIEKAIENDSRAQMPIKSNIDKAAAATGSHLNKDYVNTIKALIEKNDGQCDSTLIAAIRASKEIVFTALGKDYTLDEVVAKAPLSPSMPANAILPTIERVVNNAFDSAMIDYEIDQLEYTEPSYSNLINEYRDGILLFDISNAKVWDRATKDTDGLNAYFDANREKYCTWTAPKFKSYILFAPNDSILGEIKTYAEANYGGKRISEIDQTKFVGDIKEHFGRNAKVERVIAAKGDNPITDYLGFGAEKPEPKNQNWNSYTTFAQEIIEQPQEVSDAKGAIVTDYQAELEQQWIQDLRQKYQVKINKKALNKANK